MSTLADLVVMAISVFIAICVWDGIVSYIERKISDK